jgi:hypothetical protein
MTARHSRLWATVFPVAYALIRVLDPALGVAWAGGGLGITARLTVRGRRTGRDRSVLVGLISVDDRWYVGHPNGDVAWTANLETARTARVAPRPGSVVEVGAAPLGPGRERASVIAATSRQQPFPANLLYRAARRHILAEGRYFRLEPMAR